MPKKKAVKSGLVPSNGSSALASFTVGGNLDVNDILSVVTSKAETRYTEQITECREVLATLEEKLGRAKKVMNRLINTDAVAPHKSSVATLSKALAPFGIVVVLNARRHCAYDAEEKKLYASMHQRRSGETYTCLDTSLESPVTQRVLDAAAKVKEIEKAIDDTKNEAMEWKRRLNNVPMLERRFRAKIATRRLEADENGQQLLALMQDGLEEELDSLSTI